MTIPDIIKVRQRLEMCVMTRPAALKLADERGTLKVLGQGRDDLFFLELSRTQCL